MHRSEIEKDRPERATSDSILLHIVDEMPLRVVLAITFVAFFFVWGGVNTLIRLTSHNIVTADQTIGVNAGLMAAAAVPFVIWRIKRRAK
jgi:hypothetical protein